MKDLYIITGATGGMGLDASKHFSNKGHLLLLDVNLEKLTKLKNELNSDVDVMKFDITSSDDIDRVVEFVRAYGGFKYLLNFAGVSESMGNSELIYKINLIGLKNLNDSLYEYIGKGGVVINVASIAAHITPVIPDLDDVLLRFGDKNSLTEILKITETTSQAYGWSKLGVVMLTKKEASKWGDKSARIIAVSPGVIETPMVAKERKTNPETIDKLVELSPVNRIGLPVDITNLIDFLISDNASFITGTEIVIDGGVTTVINTL